MYRKVISKTANFLASLLVWTGRTDMTGSFRLYRTSILQELLNEVQSSGYAFQMETIVKAERKGYKIVDSPIIFKDREYGKSKLGIEEIYKFAWTVFHLTMEHAYTYTLLPLTKMYLPPREPVRTT
jgi:dolichol-phosphate mannosyltransferase